MAGQAQGIQLIAQTRLVSHLSEPGNTCTNPPSSDHDALTCLNAADGALTPHEHEASDAQPDVRIGDHSETDLYAASPESFVRSRSASIIIRCVWSQPCLEALPSEVLTLVAGFLDVDDLLHTSRTCRRLRGISLDPILHQYRLRTIRLILPPLLVPPHRPSLNDLISRSIFLTNNNVISRRLARSLVSIRLSRRLASRPSAEALVQRCVLPKECVPGMVPVLVAPGLVAKRKAIEKERLKDGLRRWIACKWKGEVKEREEDARRSHEHYGVGRVWRLRRFWERMSRGEMAR